MPPWPRTPRISKPPNRSPGRSGATGGKEPAGPPLVETLTSETPAWLSWRMAARHLGHMPANSPSIWSSANHEEHRGHVRVCIITGDLLLILLGEAESAGASCR